MAKTAKKVPVSAVLFGLVGVGALVRGTWRSRRALTKKATLESCAGPAGFGVCRPTLKLRTTPGSSILAVGGGRVVSVGPNWVHVNVASEPVITSYYGLIPAVQVGNYVLAGAKIGRTDGDLEFGVDQIIPEPSAAGAGSRLQPIEPASWLVSRGYKIASKLEGGNDLWCAGGRHLDVPTNVHGGCKLSNPTPTSFALLPVSVQQQ